MPTDEELMSRVAGGDMDAFEDLVRRHQQSALNVAYRFVGDASRAEDIVQDAFLRLLAAAERYRPTAAFRTYLYNIIWHLCVDFYRKSRPVRLRPADARPDRSPGPAETALRRERADLVRRAVDALPPRQRMAVVLQHFEGMSYDEIAEALECSSSAVDALLVRARRKLKDALADML
jgi:RNA polymerase sigma-70 factor (ECF subfamily)